LFPQQPIPNLFRLLMRNPNLPSYLYSQVNNWWKNERTHLSIYGRPQRLEGSRFIGMQFCG
jgi:hypothetical protein